MIIYSKADCPWCDKAKALLNQMDEHYEEVMIGRDITKEEFVEKFPDVKTVPYTVVGAIVYPSYETLAEWLNNPVRKKTHNF
jgi:glutaredoxin